MVCAKCQFWDSRVPLGWTCGLLPGKLRELRKVQSVCVVEWKFGAKALSRPCDIRFQFVNRGWLPETEPKSLDRRFSFV
jgi:hypothetical protein